MTNTNSAAHGALTPGGSTGTEVRQLMTSLPQSPKRTVLYARVSTDEQARSGYSLTGQLEALRGFAESEGYDVVEEVSDPGESGAYLERPGLDRVRDLVAGGGVDVVLAQDRDRFTREPAYLYLLQEEFAKCGAKLRALNARGDDTPEGQLTEGMLDQLAKFERAKIAERTRRGRLEKARRGGIKAGRIPKYGFVVNERRDGYEVDPATASVVVRIISLVASGETIHGVKKILEGEGVPTPERSKTWSRTFIRQRILDDAHLPHTFDEIKALVAPEVAARLDPERSYGIVWHNRTEAKVVEKIKTGPDSYKLKRRFTERPREQWIAVPVPAPPGLDRETVERARARISGNVRPAVSGLRVWELSGGLLYCGHCGSRMRGQNHTKRGKTLFYYEYARKINESYGACEQRAHRAEALEEYVMEAVSALLSNPMDIIAEIDERIAAEEGIARDPHREIATLERWLEDLSAKRSRYVDLYADGVIASKAELGEKLAALYDEAEALAAALDRSDNIEKWQEQKRGVLFIYRAFAAQAPSVFTSEHRRAMYERIGLRVTAYKSSPPEIQITLDPNALPSATEAAEALDAYINTVLDEETGEWVRVEDPERKLELAIEREAERAYEDSVPNNPTCS